jgi:hypothetical protein
MIKASRKTKRSNKKMTTKRPRESKRPSGEHGTMQHSSSELRGWICASCGSSNTLYLLRCQECLTAGRIVDKIRPTYRVILEQVEPEMIKSGDLCLMLPYPNDDRNLESPVLFRCNESPSAVAGPVGAYGFNTDKVWVLPGFKP